MKSGYGVYKKHNTEDDSYFDSSISPRLYLSERLEKIIKETPNKIEAVHKSTYPDLLTGSKEVWDMLDDKRVEYMIPMQIGSVHRSLKEGEDDVYFVCDSVYKVDYFFERVAKKEHDHLYVYLSDLNKGYVMATFIKDGKVVK